MELNIGITAMVRKKARTGGSAYEEMIRNSVCNNRIPNACVKRLCLNDRETGRIDEMMDFYNGSRF